MIKITGTIGRFLTRSKETRIPTHLGLASILLLVVSLSGLIYNNFATGAKEIPGGTTISGVATNSSSQTNQSRDKAIADAKANYWQGLDPYHACSLTGDADKQAKAKGFDTQTCVKIVQAIIDYKKFDPQKMYGLYLSNDALRRAISRPIIQFSQMDNDNYVIQRCDWVYDGGNSSHCATLDIYNFNPKTWTMTDTVGETHNLLTGLTQSQVGIGVKSSQYKDLQWWTATVKEEKDKSHLDIKYPQFIGTSRSIADLNSYIRNYVLERISDDRKDLSSMLVQAKIDNNLDDSGLRVWLEADYNVPAILNDIVSLEMIGTDFTGGGNGNHSAPLIINYDLKKNRLVQAKELFCANNYPDVLSPLVRQAVLDQLNEKDDQSVTDQTSSKPEHFANILIGANDLTVVYPPYTVAGGASGIIEVPIRYQDIPGVVCLP